MGMADRIPATLLRLDKSIASATAFRLHPADPTSWTQVDSGDVWKAAYPATAEMAARAPDRVTYKDVPYTKVHKEAELTRIGTWWYDTANAKLHVCTGEDPTTNIACRMLTEGLRAFKITNPSANAQTINWTPDGTTPAATVGEALAPSESSGVIPYCGALYDIQVKAQVADSGKVIHALLWVE